MADKPASPQPSTAFHSTAAQARPLAPSSFSSSYFHHPRRVSTAAPMASNPCPTDQPQASMAPPPLPAPSMDANKLDISSLMSPPDPVVDSFAHGAPAVEGRATAKADAVAGPQPLLMSPPVSPYSKALAATAAAPPPSGQHVRDPVLYPVDDGSSPASPPQLPLFAPADMDHGRIVDQHVRARPHGIFAAAMSPPRREDYELVLAFRSQVMKHYTMNRKGWLRQERALLEANRQAGAQRYHAIMPGPAKPVATKAAGRSQRADRVAKPPQGAPRPNRNGAEAAPTAPRAARTSRPARGGRVSATPEPSSRRASQPSREDKDFNALPDYCPPLESLPNRPNSLKVDWKGQLIDLSNDANAHLMHPDELTLAASLRLDCATYLTSKRRMFERRLHCLRTGKEFRKTDAQQACKIDVNKASKLWTAFDKVGWLDASWVRQYL